MPKDAPRRSSANQRLVASFLDGAAATLAELADLLAEDEEDTAEMVAHELERLGSTAGSLKLESVREACTEAIAELPDPLALQKVVRAIRGLVGQPLLAPIAFIGDARVTASIASQDDGVCEPVYGFPSADALIAGLGTDWPQAVVLPATLAHEVPRLREAYHCRTYAFGAPRDTAGRMAASRVGVDGFFAEPLSLREVLAHVRFASFALEHAPLVLLTGGSAWTERASQNLEEAGMRVLVEPDLLKLSSVLHSSYPDAVVLGPGDADAQRDALLRMRQHHGRSHIALMVVGSQVLLEAGADDVLRDDDDLARRVRNRLERFADFRRDRDDLTQVPNRAGALEAIQRAVAWSERSGQPISVVVIVARGLAGAARSHGDEARNAARRHLCAALERGLRRVDMVGNLGGDVFVAMLVGCRQADAKPRMAELTGNFERRMQADRRLRGVKLAYGIADTTRGIDGLLARANSAISERRDD